MTGPEQNGNARPDGRARWDERDRDGRGRDRDRRDERARDGDGRVRDGRRYDRQNGGRRDGDAEPDFGPGPAPDGGTGSERARGRVRGPLLGEYAPPYRRRTGKVAAVLLYRNGGHRVVWPDRVEDVDKPVLGFPYTVFEVRLGRNVTEFRLRLPAAGDGVFFEALARVQWVVTDPYLVVQEQVEDVAELLRDELLDGLRRLSRRFRITEAQRADEAVREELATGRLAFGRDIGLRTRVLVFIDLDASVKAEVSRRDRVDVTIEADERVAEAERRREAAGRALVADRARELEALFRRGDLAQIAHHMAMHPDKQWEIRSQLQRERREGQEDYLAVFNRLLDTGVLERHDIGEQMYQVLMYLRSQTGTVIEGITDRVLNPPGGARGRRIALEDVAPEPRRPDWDEEHRTHGERGERGERGDAPEDPRVYEPTRVESGSERERERDRYEPYDPYERTDRYGRYERTDPYDHEGGDRPDRAARPVRPSEEFHDWDDE
ncbi:hypothetical protein [Streptomyces sp. WAC08241]|uniref:hypothetical protein n=1 Tax=Streptomyces sp. WAC08241 TaxID=2487421 RepID=UPI000F76684F|nr:hypothetical protein [Streptomyces sp. WAC08241]RSS36586.1 hypothetical protein EF906_24965 [Streptomyces sp. WAC08241]